jgi:CBS domain-containing protein
VAGPDDELHEMMGVMTERRIRHLPVVDQGLVVGIVSIGDLLNACRVLAEDENTHLRQYIHGRG